MPNEKKGEPTRSYLEQMSTEELEQLLYQDVAVSGVSEPDPTYIKTIMEVIEKRDAQLSRDPLADLDTEAAWNIFQQDYQDQSDAFESAYLHDDLSHHPNQITKPVKKTRWSKILRSIIVAAAAVVILCGAASALGFNVFQAVADWTAEVFGFAERNAADPFEEIREAVAMKSSIPAIPNWAPESTKSVSSVTSSEFSFGTRMQGTFETENGAFYVRVYIYLDPDGEFPVTYQKDKNKVIEYPANGIRHFLMDNNGKCTATWKNENVEVYIQGDLSVEDLKRMIDSIYEE